MILYFQENIIHEIVKHMILNETFNCNYRDSMQFGIDTQRNYDYIIISYWLLLTYKAILTTTMLKHRSTSLPTNFPVDPLKSVIRNNYYYY